MTEVMINTAFGQMPAAEAASRFSENHLTNGARLGIFNQLAQHAVEHARPIALMVLNNPGIFGDKIDKAVKNFVGNKQHGPKFGVHVIKTEDDIWKVLGGLTPGLHIRVRFRTDAQVKLTDARLKNLRGTHIDLTADMDVNLLRSRIENRWFNRSNKMIVRSKLTTAEGVRDFITNLGALIEMIEVLP